MLKRRRYILLPAVLLAALGGCVTLPTGPSVLVLPAPGKSFTQFQADDSLCRQWARQQIGMSPQEAVNQNTATGAIVGSAVGAGLGAIIGSATGHAGAGAAVGAAGGLLVGASSGANAGMVYGWEAQRRYDYAYQQCMYANGNIIPGTRRVRRTMPPPPPPAGFDSATPDSTEFNTQPYFPPPPPPAR